MKQYQTEYLSDNVQCHEVNFLVHILVPLSMLIALQIVSTYGIKNNLNKYSSQLEQ